MSKEIYKMFGKLTVRDLRYLLCDIISDKLRSYPCIYDELAEQESGRTRESQFKFLNKTDLLEMIYSIIVRDIEVIDIAPSDTLRALLFRQWCCPQLKERIQYRIKNKE